MTPFTKGTLAAGDAMRERLAASEAEVERLKTALRDVAERQREACAREVEGVVAYRAALRDECVDAVRITPLVTEDQ